ncbi:MAG: hypothetical protein QMB62_03610, partial [Oscillospiraceae bacterium]
MSEDNQTRFLEMFPFCADLADMCGGLDGALVKEATVNKEKLHMKLTAVFRRSAIPAEIHTIEGRIAAEYGLLSVALSSQSPEAHTEKPAKPGEKKKKSEPAPGKVIFGKPIKGALAPMETLSAESGNVVIRGEIFFAENREIAKTKAWVLCFEMTDNTGSIRVSKYFKPGDDRGSLESLKKGMYVTVSGNVA